MNKLNAPLIQEVEENKSSILPCALLLANGAIGAGILTLSIAVSKVGWGLGAGLFVFFGLFAGYANMMLYLVQHYTRQTTYSGVARKMFGKPFEWFVDLVQLLYSFGACVGYAIIIADELHLFLSHFLQYSLPSTFSWLYSREFVLVFVTVFFILPPSLMKKITALKYTSLLAISGILYLTVVMVIQSMSIRPCDLAKTAAYMCNEGTCAIQANVAQAAYKGLDSCIKGCQAGVADVSKSQIHSVIFNRNLFLALPVFCYGHCSQVQFIPIVSDLQNPTKKRVSVVILLAYLLIFSTYIINSLSGYLSFCGYATGNILDSYASDNTSIAVGRLIIAIALCFTFPLYGYNVREVTMKMCRLGDDVEYWKLALVTVVYVLFSSFSALFLKSLVTVVAVTGATGGSLIEAIIPAIMLYIKYIYEIPDDNKVPKYILSSFYILLGVAMAIIGTYVSLTQ